MAIADARSLPRRFLVALAILLAPSAGRAAAPPAPVVGKVSVSGNGTFPESDLTAVLRTRKSGFLSTARLDSLKLSRDVERLESFYHRQGFLRARVFPPEVVPRPDGESVEVRFRLTEGPRTFTGTVGFAGNVSATGEELAKRLTLHSGDPFDELRVQQDIIHVYSHYADRGFLFCQIEAEYDTARVDTVPVLYRVVEGDVATIGEIDVTGNELVRSAFVRRELTFHEGDLYRQSRVEESVERLFETGLFADVRVQHGDPEEGTGRVPLTLRVRERDTRWVGTGIGYGTEDQVRLSAEWTHRSLWGTGRRLSLNGIFKTDIFNVTGRSDEYDLALGYVEPWVLNTRTTGNVDLFSRKEFRPFALEGDRALLVGRTGASFRIYRKIARHGRGWVTYVVETINVDEADTGQPLSEDLRSELGYRVNSSLSLTLERDSRDDLFSPTAGSVRRMEVRRVGGPLGGDDNFSKGSVSARGYHRWGPGVWAGHVTLGAAIGHGPHPVVPTIEQFVAGGPTTVRGYREGGIGPGRALFLANAEYRLPIAFSGRVGLTTFLDAGEAWSDQNEIRRTHLAPVSSRQLSADEDPYVRAAVGLGIRVRTPVGPLRLDYGRKLIRGLFTNSEGHLELETPGRFHLSVGQAF